MATSLIKVKVLVTKFMVKVYFVNSSYQLSPASWILMADFDSMVTALSFIRHIYEANECPSVEAKICLMPLMLLDSCKTTDGGAVTPVARFHMERSQL